MKQSQRKRAKRKAASAPSTTSETTSKAPPDPVAGTRYDREKTAQLDALIPTLPGAKTRSDVVRMALDAFLDAHPQPTAAQET